MSSTTPGSDPERPHDPDAVDRGPSADDAPADEASADTGAHEPLGADDAAAASAPDAPAEPEPGPERAPEPVASPEPDVRPADAAPEVEPEREPEPAVAEPAASEPTASAPIAPPEPEPAPPAPVVTESAPADDTSRLDAAVQRANAEPVASDDVGEHGAPEPVPAGSVRRETYVPAATVAAGTAAGAATLAPEPDAVPTALAAPQTVYVQAPNPPKSRGNRGFGVVVALVAAAVFALLYAGIGYLVLLAQSDPARAATVFVQFVAQPVYWVPIIATFVGFTLLAAIVNRGAWWYYAVFGLLVGVFVYLSYIGAALLTVQAWTMTIDEANDFIRARWLDPFALIAGILAREITIWLGGWVASRGRAVTERNRLAREAYDRELAAGPQPTRP
ncbi:hypothetical protein [Agromyces mariniharenae]|uniref:Uncharacterized protein n=1 Tax=Agromyces mariniharenae TaxID=2604423 RepID=A0A5S4V5I7_9MICO|nr:hypothetical protein [Agromyces mariniharenae]TYL54252.1 hypothetical protein FYC51_11860 [Agromyces mariniharenae]